MNRRGPTKEPKLKQPYEITFAKQIFSQYKVDARKKRVPVRFALTFEEFFKLLRKNCFYCESAPSNKKRHRSYPGKIFYYSGLDRKDNKKGYTSSNVVPCCQRCNKIKSDLFTFEEMQALAEFLRHLPSRLAQQQVEEGAAIQLVSILKQIAAKTK